VVLIGDAAHASSPLMGQGGSLAMEDAAVLAEVLQAEPDLEQAFAAYTRRRAPRVRWVQAQSRAVALMHQSAHRYHHADRPIEAFLSQAALHPASIDI
jgi:2-polyprenyl-6-methoxyphenol hydroxylase-like FAD-dependent oxidoreductase